MGVLKYLIKYFQVPYLCSGISMEIQELWVFRALSLFWGSEPNEYGVFCLKCPVMSGHNQYFGLPEILGYMKYWVYSKYWVAPIGCLKREKAMYWQPAWSCSFCTSPNHLLGGTCHHLEERIASNQDKWCIPSGFESMLCVFRKYYFKSFMNIFHVLRYLLQHKHRLKGETRERAFSRPSPCVRNELL